MKFNIFLIGLLFVMTNGNTQTVVKLWETDTVFRVPESVLFDDTIVYVSNVDGKPTEKNGKGFISRITSDGEIVDLNWVKGLNAPKGMGVVNNYLYVTDIDRISIIDRSNGKVLKNIEIPEAKFLNDIAVSETGMVAVSDMLGQTVYFIEQFDIIFKVNDEKLIKANGLCFVGNDLFIGIQNNVYKYDLATKVLELFIRETGSIDGIEYINNQRFVVSDWSGRVQIISSEAQPVILFDTTNTGKNAADIDWVPNRNVVLVPTFYGNTIAAYQLVK